MGKTEIRLLNRDTFDVEASVEDAEKLLSDAARSGQSRLAWFIETDSGERVGINPAHVASLRPSDAPG